MSEDLPGYQGETATPSPGRMSNATFDDKISKKEFKIQCGTSCNGSGIREQSNDEQYIRSSKDSPGAERFQRANEQNELWGMKGD